MPFKQHPTDKDKMVYVSTKYSNISIDDDYERGFIDGMQKQMQSSVDKAVNAMSKKEWVGLTDEEISKIYDDCDDWEHYEYERLIEAKLKEKNHG